MRYRELGRTGWSVSEVSFGAWAIGSMWGKVDDSESMAALHRAVDLGVNFFDTADVYGNGHSEQLLARLRKERSETIYVATKIGRKLSPHTADNYTQANLVRSVEDCLRNFGRDCLDLVQLHCPPTAVYSRPEVFGVLDELVKAGKIRFYGVSVQTIEEGLKAIEYPRVQSVQIIFNMFRLRPVEVFFPEARRRKVGILARVPLASGLLTGKMTDETTFPSDDHRNFNRHGEAFDVGETFSGIDFEVGLKAVSALENLLPPGATMAQFALRWILMFEAVTCAIPGAKRPAQVEQNARAADLPPLSDANMEKVVGVYDTYIRKYVHQRW
jgi:aryl-alcohol dehydrogenase-like predicted oxidoreductase